MLGVSVPPVGLACRPTERQSPPLVRRAKSFSINSSRGRTRTADPVINSHLLYQLSYSGLGGES